MRRILLTLFITCLVITGGIAMQIFSSGEKYHVEYPGGMEFWHNAKEYYRAGEQVTVYFDLIATDTDYTWYVDGEEINFGWDEKKGFVISFIMPDHDVVIDYDNISEETGRKVWL